MNRTALAQHILAAARGILAGDFTLSNWNTYAGGTGGGGKTSYDLQIGKLKYSISPFTTQRGRFAGYFLSVFPGENSGHAGIDASGKEVHVNSTQSVFRSPQAAAKAAAAHNANRGVQP